MPIRRFDAVLFDLLSALLDSWSLWDDVAGGPGMGHAWRLHYLDRAYDAGAYRPYDALIARATEDVGLDPSLAAEIVARWDEVEPWPEATRVVADLATRVRVGVVTNCSEALGQRAAARVGVPFHVVVTAERAGFYKPVPAIYEKAIEELGATPARTLFVAGSPADVSGAAAVGMPVYWHNRLGLANAEAQSAAMAVGSDLWGVTALVE